LDTLAVEPVARRQIVGMKVVDDNRGRDREEALEVVDALAVGLEGLEVLEVPDVVANPGAFPLGQAEGVLQLSPASEDRSPQNKRERDAGRRGAARAPDQQRRLPQLMVDGADDRIVGTYVD